MLVILNEAKDLCICAVSYVVLRFIQDDSVDLCHELAGRHTGRLRKELDLLPRIATAHSNNLTSL